MNERKILYIFTYLISCILKFYSGHISIYKKYIKYKKYRKSRYIIDKKCFKNVYKISIKDIFLHFFMQSIILLFTFNCLLVILETIKRQIDRIKDF